MSRLDEIKARAEQVHWTSTSIEQATARMASSAADVPWLLSTVECLTDLCGEFRKREERLNAEVERLRGWIDRSERQEARARRAEAEVARLTAERDALAQIKRHIDEVRNGTGWTVQIYGVLLQQCDQYGKTIDTRRAERAEAERDALAAQVARVEKLAEEWRYKGQFGWGPWQIGEGPDPEGYVMDHCASALRAALADPEADTGEQEAGHRCEPYYSRSQCGQCGWQEQWCVTCSRQMCGCATETTDQEDQA